MLSGVDAFAINAADDLRPSSESSFARLWFSSGDGKKSLFEREKLTRSVQIALRKRPVEADQIDQLVSGIVRQVEASGDAEISSSQVGAMVMTALKGIDPVGYVRYASVYKDFTDPGDFARFIEANALDEEDGQI